MKLFGTFGKTALVVATATAVVGSGGAVAGAATHHGRARVTLHVTKHGYVRAPHTIRPGRVHLHATGELPFVLLVKSKHHHTAARLVHDMRGSSAKKFFSDFALVTELHDGYTSLSRGTYFAVAPIGRPAAGKIATVRVSGKTQNAKVPAAATYRIDSHRKLHAPATQSSHRWVHVVNNSAALQELILIGIAKDTSDSDVAAFVKHPSEANFDKLDTVDFATGGVVGAHYQLWTNAHLHPRRYIASFLDAASSDLGFADPHVVTVH